MQQPRRPAGPAVRAVRARFYDRRAPVIRAAEGAGVAGRGTRARTEREAVRRSRAYAVRQAVHAARGARRRRDNRLAVIVLVLVVALATTAQVLFFTAGPGAPKPEPTASSAPTSSPTPTATVPPKALAENRTWRGTITIGGAKLAIRLDGRKAPQAVANFVSLTRSGFYEGSSCPRITTPPAGLSVLQCGSPAGSGTGGGPGYTFGPLENVPKDGVYGRGVLAMARASAPDSQGSQFFLVYGRTALPAPGYTVFGSVTSGLPALEKAVIGKGTTAPGGDGPPASPVSIGSVAVR